MLKFQHNKQTWYWNGFGGFFFQPVGPGRKRERLATEGSRLYAKLKVAAHYP